MIKDVWKNWRFSAKKWDKIIRTYRTIGENREKQEVDTQLAVSDLG